MFDKCGTTVNDYPKIGAVGARATGDAILGLTSVYKVEDEGAVRTETTVGKVGYANHGTTLGAAHISFEAVMAGKIEDESKVEGAVHKAGKPLPPVNSCVKTNYEIDGPAKTSVDVKIDCTSGVYTTGLNAGDTTVEHRAVTEPGGVLEDAVCIRYLYLICLEVSC